MLGIVNHLVATKFDSRFSNSPLGCSHDLFLCFSSEHKALVRQFRITVQDRLSLLAFDDWPMPDYKRCGWRSHAEHLIRSCNATLCLVGQSTCNSEPVNWEIRKSADLGKCVMAVCIEPTELLPDALVELGVNPLPFNLQRRSMTSHHQPAA